jgi:glutathione peroxidase
VDFTQLAVLHKALEDQGFSVLAFPSNDFHQELGSNQEIQAFLHQHFPEITFPLFGMSSLKDNPVYQELQRQLPNAHIGWNFFKYLVGRDGISLALFDIDQDPFDLQPAIEEALRQPIVNYS